MRSLLALLWAVRALAECEQCEEVAATSLVQNHLRLSETKEEKPWDRRVYMVGTNHKCGSQLLRNIMCHAFDALGATESCQYSGAHGHGVTTMDRHNKCSEKPLPLRFHNHVYPKAVEELRNETQGTARMVAIVRNPMEMIASAYCYHHRGAEFLNPIVPLNITLMGPREGVPAVASSLMKVIIKNMANVAKMAGPDLLIVRYEDFTTNSASFDTTVQKVLDFMFEDEISGAKKAEIGKACEVEDASRGLENGISHATADSTNVENHTNDEEDMVTARKCLALIPDDVYEEYVQLQHELAYV